MSSGSGTTPPGPRESPTSADLQRRADALAHDFNNLLNTIAGYANLLARSLDEDDPRRADAEEIVSGAQRVSDLVVELTRLSRLPEPSAPAVSVVPGADEDPDEGDARRDAEVLRPSGRTDTARATVLVVDDERPVRYLVRTLLTRAGYEVSEAATADEADQQLAARQGAVDLVISDVALPASSGPELVQRLRARQPGLKVLFMSGYSDEQIRRDGSVDPDTPFVQKPFTVDALTGAVRQILGR
jgi:CheY-like chemotaxis protein